MSETNRPGIKFQNFVAMLERVLHDAEGVEIHSPLRLPDKDTGRLREHDVVIVRTTHHGRSMTAVEARYRSRKVTVGQVESFAKKCERTGIHHGVIVAAKGFAQSARKKADALSVSCVDLAKAEAFPWIGASKLVGRVFNYLDLRGEVAVDDPDKRACEPYLLIDRDGNEVGSNAFADLIDLDLACGDDVPANVPQSGVLEVTDGRFRIRDKNAEIFEVGKVKLHYTFVVTETHVPFQLRHYQSGSANMEIAHSHAGDAEAKAEFMLISTAAGVTGIVTHHSSATPRVRVGDGPSRPLRQRAAPSSACEIRQRQIGSRSLPTSKKWREERANPAREAKVNRCRTVPSACPMVPPRAANVPLTRA